MGGIINLVETLFVLSPLVFFLLPPLVLTAGNIYNLFAKKPFHEDSFDKWTFILGPVFMTFLGLFFISADWNEPLYFEYVMLESGFHTPLASWHLPTLLILALWGLVSFCVLRFFEKPMPPMPTVACISGIEVGVVLSVVFIVQMSAHLFDIAFLPGDTFYMILYPVNYLLCVPRLLRRVIRCQMERLEDAPPLPEKRVSCFCQRLLARSLGWVLAGFLLAIPLLIILLCILVLFGQAPDAIIRVFTETSEWALSTKESTLPPVWSDDLIGHYLCTVAVGGHPKLVRPLRYGIRHGRRIVVNRQLCIANAFEQLLMERTPRFHRAVRSFYDAHGYPLSKKITTPLRADITYLLMKPLEWFFLLCLYTFDVKPEDRIAMQYTQR